MAGRAKVTNNLKSPKENGKWKKNKICQKKRKKKPNEHKTVKHNLQDLRFIEKGIWKASIQKKKKKKPKKKIKIIANKFNNHSSIQQSKHYKLHKKTTKKYIPKIA